MHTLGCAKIHLGLLSAFPYGGNVGAIELFRGQEILIHGQEILFLSA